ncbi:glycosyl transferase [Belliella baltica DSM 15883]|uniref:Glycosyl transferase n=1 Tax=Belliella baltica (strain DSM 15883 / CIP 108006 / LMG 21964 / BA134) TaxID=866536 RepID=I3Z6T4_BELBD|nr:glycosyltransferase [Belliella baltica]AFL84952.1 glycosyl transferase [Belliella baltica DSM 15883]
MRKQIDFSCLMSIYQRDSARFLKEALNSINNQTLKANEIVLVKDGPVSLELDAILSEFQDKLPLKIISIDENRGLGHALSFGLNFISNDIVARMDADDISVSNRFEKQIDILIKNPEYDLVSSNIEEFNNVPGDLGIIKKVPEKHEDILKYSQKRSPFNHPSVVFRKQAVLNAGSYKSMLFFEDYYLWLRLIKSGRKFYNIQDPLLYFRVGNNMIGRRQGFKYALHEYNFFKSAYKEKLISLYDFINAVLIRFPLRLLPVSTLKFIYSSLLRK